MEDVVDKVWHKARIIKNMDSKKYRKDPYGITIYK